MKIFKNSFDVTEDFYGSCYTIGNFDGIHKGHRQILRHLIHAAKKRRTNVGVISFHPHPKQYFSTKSDFFLLCTRDEKYQLLESLGVDILVELPFDKKLQTKKPDEFIEEILYRHLRLSYLALGKDFCFGHNRHGNVTTLRHSSKKYGFTIDAIELKKDSSHSMAYNSSMIRKLLYDGNVKRAAEFLERFFCYEGTVIKGQQLGRLLGFPTANIVIEPHRCVRDGIYGVTVQIEGGKKHTAVGYCSKRQHENSGNRIFEAHINDFFDDIYGQKIKIELCEFIRDDKFFDNRDELIEQIKIDQINSKRILAELGDKIHKKEHKKEIV